MADRRCSPRIPRKGSYDPVTGEGLGADDFSWTAAGVIDVLRA